MREALTRLDPIWDELFPAKQAKIVQLLVERVDVRMHGVKVPVAAERTRRAGSPSCGQPEGGGVTRATVSADGETITVHIPMKFTKRGGRKLVVMPDGAPWAPRPRVDTRW